MSSRIKRTYYFDSPNSCIFFYSDLPLGFRISKNNKQRIGDLLIFSNDEKVYKCELSTIPNLNSMQQWNQNYFNRLFSGMSQFIISDQQDNQIHQQQVEQNISSKTGLVRDLTQKQEIYLLRCKIYQEDYHKKIINNYWDRFQKYNKAKKKSYFHIHTTIQQTKIHNQHKVQHLKKLLNSNQQKKNELRCKLTEIYKQKINKLKQFCQDAQDKLINFDRYQQESNISASDMQLPNDGLNSQQERQFQGSIFQPTQFYEMLQKSQQKA